MPKQIFAVLIAIATIAIMSCDDNPSGSEKTLAAPVITVTPDTSALTVSWTAVPDADYYNVYHDTTPGVTTSSNAFQNVTVAFLKHTGLSNGVTYYYRVEADGENVKVSPLSEEKSGTPISVAIDPPENFEATGWDGKITMSWTKSIGASTYSIYWDTTSGVTATSNAVDGITPLGYEHAGLTNGKKYYYRIAAKDAAGASSDLSDEINATPESSVENPKNLTATPGNTFVILDIDKYTGKEVVFRVYWATTAGVTTASDTIVHPGGKEGISFPYTQTGVTNGTTYFYRAMAIVSETESGLSNEASAIPSDTISIGVPQKVTATKGDAQVAIIWDAVTGAATYTIFWDTATGVTEASDTLIPLAGKPGYLHDSLTNYVTYYYRMNAVDANGNKSALSDEVSATPDTLAVEGTPKNVVATAGVGQVTLTWDMETGGYYTFYWDTKSIDPKNATHVFDKEKSLTSPYVHTGLDAGTTYYYKVANWISGEALLSLEVSAIPTK